MTCPYCGKEMIKGTVRHNGCSYFLPDGEKRPAFYTAAALKKRNAVALGPNPYRLDYNDWPEAYICEECKKIILPYNERQT